MFQTECRFAIKWTFSPVRIHELQNSFKMTSNEYQMSVKWLLKWWFWHNWIICKYHYYHRSYRVQCTLCIMCTLYSVQSTVFTFYSVRNMFYRSVHMYSVQCTHECTSTKELCIVHCGVYISVYIQIQFNLPFFYPLHVFS